MIHLLTHEKKTLSFFITLHPDARREFLIKTRQDPASSGPLIRAMELITQNIT